MSEALGDLAHRHVGSSYSAREGGGVAPKADWEGAATGYGAVFGSLIFDVPDAPPLAACNGSVRRFPRTAHTV